MSARDDGTPRRVLATIRTWGRGCDAGLHDDDQEDPESCPMAGTVDIGTAAARCHLFGAKIELDHVQHTDGSWTETLLRCPNCLALDEQLVLANGPRMAESPTPSETIAILVQALRRVRDEAEYARDLREAAYMADKHATRALIAIGDPDPDAHSGAYVCRREHNKTMDVFKAALEETRESLVESLPMCDPDEDYATRKLIDSITKALADEGPPS